MALCKATVLTKLKLSMKKGNLLVDGRPYVSNIKKLDDHKMLKLKEDEIQELTKLQVLQGDTIVKGSSKFT